jgi:hypothetical protein
MPHIPTGVGVLLVTPVMSQIDTHTMLPPFRKASHHRLVCFGSLSWTRQHSLHELLWRTITMRLYVVNYQFWGHIHYLLRRNPDIGGACHEGSSGLRWWTKPALVKAGQNNRLPSMTDMRDQGGKKVLGYRPNRVSLPPSTQPPDGPDVRASIHLTSCAEIRVKHR